MSLLRKIGGYAGELGLDVFFMKGVPMIFSTLYGAYKELPQEHKEKIPGIFGYGLADEQIVGALVAQLADIKDRVIIMKFLDEKCKDYERSRFILIVAGMEFFPAIREEKTIKYAKDGKKESETIKAGSPAIDLRLDFLKSFADIIRVEFNGDLDKAYRYCIGGRMIIANPLHRKIWSDFSDSTKEFKKFALDPFGAISLKDLATKATDTFKAGGESLSADLQSFRRAMRARRNAGR